MPTASKPTQDFVPIKEVRDGIVVLKDGSLRAILLTSSMNFALKSEDEQKAVIMQFQNFLNSLDFSVQIFIQSRKLDIRPYIALLEERYKNQNGELLKVQTREYINFIKSFTDSTNIMTKSFFVVVSYSPALISTSKNPLQGILENRTVAQNVANESAAFDENRTQLEQRISVVAQGLSSTGIRVIQLGSEEVIELFYKIFNPGELDKPIQL